ncbi:MAG: dinitrogenase iron-molybdenum cofactor biosynthesis protein [Clostridiales bacterium]|nr:dinitrogenase iron-molybdenum cofactor biosynthesis protein [Clostridiales bacterium]
MIIILPLDENKTDICVSFGRCPFLMIYDTENNSTEITENSAANAQGGAGIKSAQFIVDSKADALITVRCGENAAEVLNAAGVKIYKPEGIDAEHNIALLKDAKLSPLTHFHAGFHGIQ